MQAALALQIRYSVGSFLVNEDDLEIANSELSRLDKMGEVVDAAVRTQDVENRDMKKEAGGRAADPNIWK